MKNASPNTHGIAGLLNRHGFVAFILFAGAVGTFLRLYSISDQILLNDEWHGLFYAAMYPVNHLLGHASIAATSHPLNVYYRVLLKTVGWSENWIRLPSLLPGILSLVLFPFIVKKAHGKTVAILFSIFLALSPFLTFYSRVARPYSMLVFLIFLSVYSAGFWLLSNKKRYLWVYILSAPLAVYFHVVAIASVFAPLAIGGACSVFKPYLSRHFPVPQIRPSLLALFLTGILLLAFSTAALMPSWEVLKLDSGNGQFPTLEIWRQFVLLLFGTSSGLAAVVLLCFGASGAVILFRKNFFWGAVFALLWLLHVLMIAVSRIAYGDVPIVLARYLIVLFPICFVWVGIAVEQSFLFIQKNSSNPGKSVLGGALLLAGALLFTNPLRDAYTSPNNFTNHSAFQESYDPFHDGRGTQPYRSLNLPKWATLRPANMPAFYRTLPASTQCLIEYPLIMEDDFDPYYYYQRYHKKRVIAGYLPVVASQSEYSGNDVNLLSIACPPEHARFKNMVNILDAEAVRKTPANRIILHRNLVAESLPGKFSADKTKLQGIEWCVEKLQKNYGPPVYTDESVIVFDVSRPEDTGTK